MASTRSVEAYISFDVAGDNYQWPSVNYRYERAFYILGLATLLVADFLLIAIRAIVVFNPDGSHYPGSVGTIWMTVVEGLLSIALAYAGVMVLRRRFSTKFWLPLNLALVIYWNTIFGVAMDKRWLLIAAFSGVDMGIVNTLFLYSLYRIVPARVTVVQFRFGPKDQGAPPQYPLDSTSSSAPLLERYTDDEPSTVSAGSKTGPQGA